MRTKLVGEGAPTYSEYTCYTGISSFTPPDIDVVGYRVFLGNGQYFVSSDVGGGRMQWYGFHREPAGGDDAPGARKERLLQIFGHWSDMGAWADWPRRACWAGAASGARRSRGAGRPTRAPRPPANPCTPPAALPCPPLQ